MPGPLIVVELMFGFILTSFTSFDKLFWLPIYFTRKKKVNYDDEYLHSKRSASVFVRKATGRFVLSFVMANSCMPSSSATLACVLLLTRELRNNCQWKVSHQI